MIGEEFAEFEKEWQQSRDHFDLVIRRRKAVRQQINTLTDKISIERKAITQLSSDKPSEAELPAAPKTETEKNAGKAEEAKSSGLAQVIPRLPAQ